MKTIFAGSELNTALRELKKEVPGIDRLIFSANGKLDITGFNSTNFQGTTVHMPCETAREGSAGMKSFDLLYSLSQDKEFKESELVFATDGDDTLSLITTIRHTETIKGKGYHDKTRKFQMLVPADYRFEAMKDIPVNIAPVNKEAAEEFTRAFEPAPAPGPSPNLLKSVTVPSVMVKAHLPRTRDDSVKIASTCSGVIMIVKGSKGRSVHVLAASTPERFCLEIPVKTLRHAIKASDTLTVGIREKGFEWHGLKDTHGHPAKERPLEDYFEGDALREARAERLRGNARETFHFVEGIMGEVNGIPVPNVRRGEAFQHGDRVAGNSVPSRHVIGYRDTMKVPVYRKHGFNSSEERDIYGPWHFVRLLNVPTAIAHEHARNMSEKHGRPLESVYLGQSDEEIVLEPSVNPFAAWKILRVHRRREGTYSWNRDRWEVSATFKIEKITHKPPVGVNGDQCRKRIARDLTDEQSKILVKRLDLASKLLNGEIEQDASNTLENMLTEQAAGEPETLFVLPAPKEPPVRIVQRREPPVVIAEPETIEMFGIAA